MSELDKEDLFKAADILDRFELSPAIREIISRDVEKYQKYLAELNLKDKLNKCPRK